MSEPETRTKKFGDEVLSARKLHNMTQKELAKRTDYDIRSIQRIEKGEVNLSFDAVCSICTVLGISLDAFLNSEIGSYEHKIEALRLRLTTCTPKERELVLEMTDYLITQLLNAREK